MLVLPGTFESDIEGTLTKDGVILWGIVPILSPWLKNSSSIMVLII